MRWPRAADCASCGRTVGMSCVIYFVFDQANRPNPANRRPALRTIRRTNRPARHHPIHQLRSSGRQSAPSNPQQCLEPTHVGCYGSAVPVLNQKPFIPFLSHCRTARTRDRSRIAHVQNGFFARRICSPPRGGLPMAGLIWNACAICRRRSTRGIDETARCRPQNRRLRAAVCLWLRWRVPGGRLGRARVARTLLPEPPHQCQTAAAFCRDAFSARTPVTPSNIFSLHADENETMMRFNFGKTTKPGIRPPSPRPSPPGEGNRSLCF